MKPNRRPGNPCFSSGPCAKRPGWSPAVLEGALTGRSHRSAIGLTRLVEVVERSRAILGIPADWRVAIVAGSDTGAIEIAMWSLLGARGVDMLAWENFGEGWVADVEQLKLPDVRVLKAPYGRLPDLSQVDPARDVVFTWNGTTSGVRVPNGDWIAADRKGLTICDATSAVFAMRLPWDKLDVATWSWQKSLGGETINPPSMLCVEDALDSLKWAESVGGLDGLVARSEQSLATIKAWVERSSWARLLAEAPATISSTSPQLEIVDPWFARMSWEDRFRTARAMTKRLEDEGGAHDIPSPRASPPGLRIWTGATVEPADVALLLPWLDWAWEEQCEAARAA